MVKPNVPEWLVKNPNDERALDQGYYYDSTEPEKVIWFIENFISHYKKPWAGQPFLLEEWQKRLIHRLYGWRKPDGKRRFSQAYISMGRGGGKTKLCSALALYELVCVGKGAEVYCGAYAREQAQRLLDESVNAVKASELSKILKPYRNKITFARNNSVFVCLSGEGSVQHGSNPSFVIIDESHTFQNRKLISALESGLNKRGEDAETLLIHITTAGHPNTVWEDIYNYAKGVESGDIPDLHYLPVIYEVPADVDWRDPQFWHLGNPNIGVTVSLEKLKEELVKAEHSVTAQIEFRQLKLNQMVQSQDKWIDMAKWDACKGTIPDDLSHCRTFAGVDLSQSKDITAFVLLHYDPETGKCYVEPRFYLPAGEIENTRRRNHKQYMAWAQAGILTTIAGDTIDARIILQDILAAHEKYHIEEIAVDPFIAILLREQLEEAGVPTVRFNQSKSWYTTPCIEFEKAIINGKLIHDGNSLLRWNIDNAVLDKDINGMMPSKKKAREKIDGAVALVMGFDRIIRNVNKAEPEGSVYDRRGITFLEVG